MCGIIGSTNREVFTNIFEQNKERGNFAYGILRCDINNNINIKKSNNINEECEFKEEDILFLGHLQSPTSSKTYYEEDTTHPFKYKQCYLAHNGVLSNHKELREKYDIEGNEVDSSIILPLIYKIGLTKALSVLRGTFGCWLYREDTSELFLFRSGSTIYTDGKSFSSKPIKEWKLLDEGIIYRFNYTKLIYEKYDNFKTNSGFFI